jgi:hypothetical protein
MTGDQPSRCPESEIAKLRAAEIGGYVQLAGPPPPSNKRFLPGERVGIRVRGLEGREARYVRPAGRAMSRVTVVLLNRAVEVSVPTFKLAAIEAASAPWSS